MRKSTLLAFIIAVNNMLMPSVVEAPAVPNYRLSHYGTNSGSGGFIDHFVSEKKASDLLNYKTYNFNNDNDEVLLARMIFGEGESLSKAEKIEIAYTAIHRVKEGYGKSLKEVLLNPYQYSCFNEGTDSSIFLKDPLNHNPKEFFASLEVSEGILSGKIKDTEDRATFYYDPMVVSKPKWANGLEKISRPGFHHRFYRKIKH
ncbi:MAG: cell wall hydrolase [Candidatus Nanoarchaeia archaeon]